MKTSSECSSEEDSSDQSSQDTETRSEEVSTIPNIHESSSDNSITEGSIAHSTFYNDERSSLDADHYQDISRSVTTFYTEDSSSLDRTDEHFQDRSTQIITTYQHLDAQQIWSLELSGNTAKIKEPTEAFGAVPLGRVF